MTTSKPVTPRPPLRMKLSIAAGNLIQAAGLAAGAALLALAAAMTGHSPARLAVALAGFLAAYDCSHAIGHYLAGRPRPRITADVARGPGPGRIQSPPQPKQGDSPCVPAGTTST